LNWHEAWLWLWFIVGSFAFWLKRAYFLTTGPNPVATSFKQFVQRSWAPLLVRFILDSGVYWSTFQPQVLAASLRFMGWDQFASGVESVTKFGFFALFFGYVVDSIIDFAVIKIPGVKDILPQMPPPLPKPAVIEAAIVEQTTKVTALETKTTTVPNEVGK
jgi:uncharacterized membrane protein